jgi:hypothetical protein
MLQKIDEIDLVMKGMSRMGIGVNLNFCNIIPKIMSRQINWGQTVILICPAGWSNL